MTAPYWVYRHIDQWGKRHYWHPLGRVPTPIAAWRMSDRPGPLEHGSTWSIVRVTRKTKPISDLPQEDAERCYRNGRVHALEQAEALALSEAIRVPYGPARDACERVANAIAAFRRTP